MADGRLSADKGVCSQLMQNISPEKALHEVLSEKVLTVYGAGARVESLKKLSTGASRETWSFVVVTAKTMCVPLILKRDPVVYRANGTIAKEETGLGVERAVEGKLIELAEGAGVPVPGVSFYLSENEKTTSGFVMEHLQGETLGRRILREESYAAARRRLAFQCGQAAARLHGIALGDLPELECRTAREQLEQDHDTMNRFGHPYPGFEYGFRWLEERLEWAGEGLGLVHGDFRNGNIVVNADGLRGILDWELAHVGNPVSDLGWICVRSWRYGHVSKPVGGFGEISELLAGYKAGGGNPVSPEAIHYWEVFGTLRWGVLCIAMTFSHLHGTQTSLEKAVIGRRTAETEYDLLQLVN